MGERREAQLSFGLIKATKPQLRIHGEASVENRVTGEVYDLEEVADGIRWVTATMYPPPHQYVVLGRGCPVLNWDILNFAIQRHPDSYLAYFRGYQFPMRYFEFGGRRYWRTASRWPTGVTHMLNRCFVAEVEPPRRVDQGGKPVPWEGPPWELYGTPWPEWYRQQPDGSWEYQAHLDPYRRRKRKKS